MAQLRPTDFRVGAVLGRSFEILRLNAVPFGLLALAITLPSQLYAQFVFGDRTPSAVTFLSIVPYVLIASLFDSFLTATITYRTIAELRGTPSEIPHVLREATAMILPVFGVAIAVGLLTLLGMIALIIPGFIVLTRLAVAVPAMVVERRGVWASLERSQELTAGNRWRVFAVVIVFAVIAYAADALIQAALGQSWVSTLVLFVVAAAISAWSAVGTAVMYHDLRLFKEGEGVPAVA